MPIGLSIPIREGEDGGPFSHEQELTQLWDEIRRYVFACVYHWQDSEDISQQVFCECQKRRDPITNIKGLMLTIARRRVKDHYRKQGRNPRLVELVDEKHGEHSDSWECVKNEEQLELFRVFVAELSPIVRVIVKRRCSGVAHRSITDFLNSIRGGGDASAELLHDEATAIRNHGSTFNEKWIRKQFQLAKLKMFQKYRSLS